MTLRELLRNRNYVLLQTGKFFFMVGFQMQTVAVGWHVYDLTKSPLMLGYSGLAIFIPVAIFSLIGGDVVDRVNRKRVILFALTIFFLASICLATLSFRHNENVFLIYSCLLLVGVGRGFYSPAMTSILASLVPKEHLSRAVSFGSSVWQVATITGPTIGGFLYAIHNSATIVYFTTFMCALVAFILIAQIKYKFVKRVITDTAIQRFREGISFVWNHKSILGAISLDLFAVLLGGSVALLPIFANEILNVGPRGLGILRSAPAVGAVLMATFLGYRPIQRYAGRKMFMAVGVFGVATILFGLSKDFYLSLFLLTIMGAADMISVVVRGTFIQLFTPDHMRGRVSAVSQVFIGASNELGEFESGVTANWFGTVPSVIMGGIGTCLIGIIWSKHFKELYRTDKI